ncbi:hypothetical protein KG892_02435 [Vermiphilus pyriformis]|nr:MAG: hypothetical protein KG892_02435 [Vermiphilus pyriformis]
MHLAIKILIIYGVALRVGTSQTTPIKPNFELFQANTWTGPSLDMALKPTLKIQIIQTNHLLHQHPLTCLTHLILIR